MLEPLPDKIKRLANQGDQKTVVEVAEVAVLLKDLQEAQRDRELLAAALRNAQYWLTHQSPKQAFDALNGALVHFHGPSAFVNNPYQDDGTFVPEV